MSTDLIRRHRLALVALLADVIPPRDISIDGAHSEHVVTSNIVVRRLVNTLGERAYRVVVRGWLVLHLTDKGAAPPTGFSLPGDWVDVLAAVAAPWRLPSGDSFMPSLAPVRRVHSRPSPYGTRAPFDRPFAQPPRLVRSLAEFAASLGTSNRLDLDTITLGVGELEFQVKLVRLRTEVLVIIHRASRLRLSASLSRGDPRRRARITFCTGSRWCAEPVNTLRKHAHLIDPADLLDFCRLEREPAAG